MPRSSSRRRRGEGHVEPDPDRGTVARQVLGLGERDHVVGDLRQRRARVVHDVHGLHERTHREARGVAGAAGRREHVVGAGAVVAQRHRGERAEEDRPGVADPGRPGGGVLGLDLEVLGGVGVDHGEALLEVVDQHDRGLLAGQRGADPLGVPGHRHLLVELGLDVGGEPLGRGHQHRGGGRVVLGLGDQVGRHERGVGGVVGQDPDLGRAGLGVDADDALEQPLGGHRVDRARPGDQVDLATRPGAVGEHRDGLGTADGVHLVDAEQRARGQDRRVREPAVVLLRRGGERDRRDAGDLRGHHVHHHGGHQRRDAAGHVEPDPLDRHLAVGDAGTVGEVGDDVVLELGLAGLRAAGGWTPPGRRGRRGRGRRGRRCRAAGGTAMSACSTPSKRAEYSTIASTPAGPDVVADRADHMHRGLDVELGPRHGGAVVDGGCGGSHAGRSGASWLRF